jgi:hypothetical protein
MSATRKKLNQLLLEIPYLELDNKSLEKFIVKLLAIRLKHPSYSTYTVSFYIDDNDSSIDIYGSKLESQETADQRVQIEVDRALSQIKRDKAQLQHLLNTYGLPKDFNEK